MCLALITYMQQSILHALTTKLLAVDQPVFILGDFNSCGISDHLSNQEQFVTFPTQNKRTLDKCDSNIPNTFAARHRPLLGKSDHDVVHFVPRCRQKLKAEKTQTQEIKQWISDGMEELRGCFESTEWSVFFDGCSSHNELAETRTEYYRIFLNNKPLETKDPKTYQNKKKYAFVRGNKAEVRELDKKFRRKAKLAKLAYRDKVENSLKVGSAKDGWRWLNIIMGRKNKGQTIKTDNPHSFASELNRFYARCH